MNLALAGGNLAILVDVFSSAVDIELVFGVVSTQLMGSYTRRPEVCDAMSLCVCVFTHTHHCTHVLVILSAFLFLFNCNGISQGIQETHKHIQMNSNLSISLGINLQNLRLISSSKCKSYWNQSKYRRFNKVFNVPYIYIYIYILTFIDDPYWWHIKWRFCWAKSLQSSLGSHRLTTLQFTL